MRSSIRWILAVVLVSSSLLAEDQPVAHHYFSKIPHEHVAKWSYSGATGPKFWGQLDPSYRLASRGKQQSPIDINTHAVAAHSLPDLRFDYRPERTAVLNNGHTIQHNEAPGSFLYVGEEKFSLEQFHVHAPSEHTLDGEHFDMEIHFVHKSMSNEVVVVGVLVRADENSELDLPLHSELPKQPGESVELNATRKPSDFLPRNRDYFTYWGSFTTPPCTEHVRWIVMKQPIGAPPNVIERFSAILKSNNRPVQSLHERVVEKSK